MDDRDHNQSSEQESGREVALRRAGHRWVFRFDGADAALFRETLRDLALNPNTPFDRVDAALVAHRASVGPVPGLAGDFDPITTHTDPAPGVEPQGGEQRGLLP
ncbi:MAG: hypothetical protein AAGB51_00270 [Planctomycetota bacterium]